MLKEWKFPSESPVDDAIVEAADNSELLAKLLVRRGFKTAQDIRAFLDPANFTPSSPAELPDMPRAVGRILQAIANNERITVYGDYDVDGVTSTSVMVTTLRKLGADVGFYIPNRSEGYGLNLKAVSVLASKHRTKLIITCDCGISNVAEITFARSLGVDTVIADHHSMPELMPPAVAILHPKQLDEEHPLFHLPGVGVAYKLSEALLIQQGLPEEVEKLLDFVTLGMIADMVPLTKECRYLVQVGMPFLVGSQRAGIKALLSQVKGEGTDLVGFGLAPRINAVGRLSDATLAVNLMITDDPAEAAELAKQLELENARRQELCEQIFLQADVRASQALQSGDRALAIYSTGWHHGVVGIVASRLVEKYHCPVFIGELDEKEGIVKGSARGIPGIDLYEVLKANEHLAKKWGGHKMAAGWTVELDKAELFCRGIVDTCNRALADQAMRPTLEIDLEVDPETVTQDMAALLTKMAPFGIGNKKPVLVMRKLECAATRPLGKENKHSRISVANGDIDQFECVFWNSRGRVPGIGDSMEVAFMPEINVYNGNSRLQLVLADWRDPSRPYVAPEVVPIPAATPAGTPPGANVNPSGATTGSPSASPVIDMTPPADSSLFGEKSASRSSSDAPPPAGGSATQSDLGSPLHPPGGKDNSTAGAVKTPGSAPRDAVRNASGARNSSGQSITWKDLRAHAAPESLVEAAIRKLGTAVSVYAESSPVLKGVQLVDRVSIGQCQHLLLWSYPPSDAVFRELLEKSGATNIYLIGGVKPASDDAATFLKRLLGLVRFAVNQREGQADPERIAAALGCTKMAIALGLTILKKINIIDWFAEEGILNVDILGQPTGKAEQLPDFKQLANCLTDIIEFRRWCDETPLKEIQLHFVPAAGSTTELGQAGVIDHRAHQQSSGITI